MVDFVSAVQGNWQAFTMVPAAAILLTLAVLAPFNKIIGKALGGMIPCVGSCCGCFCGFFGPWFQPVTTVILLISTVSLLALNPSPLGMILGGIGAFVGVFGVLLKKLPPHDFTIMGVPLASDKYNSFWMFLFGIGYVFFVMVLFPIGAFLGILVLIIMVVLILIALVIAGPEIGAAAGVGGAAGGLGGGGAAALEGIGAGGELGGLAGEAGQGQKALQMMGKAGGEIPEVQAIPTEMGEGGKMKMFGGLPVAETEALSEQELQQVQAEAQQQAQSTMNTQLQGVQTQEATLQQQLKTASPEQKPELEEELKQLHTQAKGILNRGRGFMDALKGPSESISSGGGLLGGGKGGSHGLHSSLGGGLSLTNVCIIIVFILALFVLVVFALPETSPAGQSLNSARMALNTVKDTIVQAVVNFVDYLASWFQSQVSACEVGATGIPCKVLTTRSCEPFCINPSGREPIWQGFQIKKVDIIPATVYDYQRFSVFAEFANDGAGTAKFSATETQPQFGYIRSGGKINCIWGLSPLGTLIGGEDPVCKTIFPVKKGSQISTISSGRCAQEGGALQNPCELTPGESTQLRWIGYQIDSESIRPGQTVTPDVTISLDYTFLVPNDVVGTMSVQTLEEQVATATVEQKERRIVGKINKAYSPPGPLMVAMGTAEEQVVAGIPSVFIVQFANKGSGVVQSVSKNDMRIYLPPEFTIRDQDSCDFERTGDVASLKNNAAENAKWAPGPGFENYIMYKPKHDLSGIGKTRNPLEIPTLVCIMNPPTKADVGGKVKTYDFKMRVAKYVYTEEKQSRATIIGTNINQQGAVAAPQQQAPAEVEKTASLQQCERLWSSTSLASWHQKCSPVQTITFGSTVKKVTKITASAVYDATHTTCGNVDILFVKNYDSGVRPVFYTLDEALSAANGINANNPLDSNNRLDKVLNIAPAVTAPTVSITKTFDTPQDVSSITAAIVRINPPRSDNSCPFIKSVTAKVTVIP